MSSYIVCESNSVDNIDFPTVVTGVCKFNQTSSIVMLKGSHSGGFLHVWMWTFGSSAERERR